MDNNIEDINNDSILYELVEYFVKKQDPELIRCKNDNIILPTTGTIKNALRYLNNRYSLPESISQEISLTLPWKFTIGDNGRLLAIIQENVMEIRKSRDEFSSIVGKASVPKDAFPQWRKLAWSPDGSILVLASSNGSLSFYNSLGSNTFNISPKTEQNPEVLEAGDAISSLLFMSLKTEIQNWTYELLIVTYSGLLKSYYIYSHGCQAKYEFSFANFYRKGVNAFAYDQKHDLFIVAGNNITQQFLSPASNTGLTSWRPLNDYPHYKLSFTFAENAGTHTLSLWNLIPTFRKHEDPVIFKISISPSCEHLLCLHTDGSISLWNLPNLQLKKKWKLNEQPDSNVKNLLNISKAKKLPGANVLQSHPVDIGWWSDHAIIIARYSGAISVCSINNLQNLLGTSPEFLYGQPQISEFYSDKGFLCLDCETLITSKKRSVDTTHDGLNVDASDSEKEEDDLEPITLMNYATNLLQSMIYSITDIESFQPKRKKSKILQRTYRILHLKSTTPEELYSRKIDIEEYDEALTLANAHNLDTDLVYQTQWRKSSYSLKDIQEHLSKVRKRSWVLNECVTRVPETFEAARELLNFGLKGANLETFCAIADTDDGKLVNEEINEDLSQLDETAANLKYTKKANHILKKINLSALSQSQKDLLVYRRSLLDHLDMLKTYEIINNQRYNKNSYEDFRQLTILENATKFAKECNYHAVGIMFTYHGQKLMPHWLGIISCFPETLNPIEYRKLLPSCDEKGQLFLLYQQELRPKDWSENPEFEAIIANNDDEGAHVIYDHDLSLSLYKHTELTMELLRKWYKSRAYQIERNSCIVENALELIRIGKSHNITGLEDLLIELETLDDLVYKIYMENMSLAQFEKLSDLEKVKLLMSTASEKNFVLHIKNFILVLINRKQKYLKEPIDKKLLRDYLVMISTEDLKLTLKFFESLKHDIDLLNLVEDIVNLALDCIYACMNPNMYQTAKEIFNTLPKPQSTRDTTEGPNSMEWLEQELECLKILNKHHVQTTAQFIHTKKTLKEDVEILLSQMSICLSGMSPPPGEEDWSELLNNMLELQEFIFTSINPEICFEIHVKSRLASGVKVTIQNCSSLIETKKNEHSLLKVSYDKAVKLILEASKEYFNSSKGLNDTSMELARACLHLIEDDNPLIQREYELIHSLQILEEFHIDILPLQVRLSQNRLKLIETCLNHRQDAYKRQQRLLTLATYLRIEENNTRSRECQVLELVALKAFDANDYEVCASTCQKIIANNYYSAWKTIQLLGFCDDYSDLSVKQQCLTFALTYSPVETLEHTLSQMHLLEIQVLNKKLENWMANYDFDSTNPEDSEDEFTDAMTTPQVEVKEFVPKIFQTSTGLVKNSAQIVKESTLGILKNMSNKNFWKSLDINSKNVQEDLIDNEHDEVHTKLEQRHEEQSFPFFYELLHPGCCISCVDTQYDRYSMPDVENTKLKICQTLLRVALLSETSCYGLEISDINHFLVQSASHVISDDWLLGFSYLLSLKNDKTFHINEIFRNLPETKLYIQSAMYFYSLELYRKIYPDALDYFSYDPMDLMQRMLVIAKEDGADEDIESSKEALKFWHQKLSQLEMTDDKINSHLIIKGELENEQKNVEDGAIKNYNDSQQAQGVKDDIEDRDLRKLTSLQIVETPDSCDNDAFKMKTYETEEGAVWDNSWGNWNDSWDHASKNGEENEDLILNYSSELKPPIYSDDYMVTDKPDVFGIDENVIPTPLHDDDLSPKRGSPTFVDDSTEQVRFQIFEDLFLNMDTKDDYCKIKNALQMWPAFTESQYTTIEKHPILRMIETAGLFISQKKGESAILQEYKDLLKDQSISSEVLNIFIKQWDLKFKLETRIFLRLCSDDSEIIDEAIDMIKNQDTAEFSLPILEKLFFNDLTSSFPPHHPVYNKILGDIFLNYNLSDVEPHITILIDKLIKQKHIPYAIALRNQLAAVPPALSTFESGFQLFMRK